MSSIFLHLHPAKVNSASLRINRTFGLGGMAALIIVFQIITGILLRFYYSPFPASAYDSILFLKNEVVFGQLIRNLHYWSGVFLVLITFLHLLRVFFTGAYRKSRKLNWLFGLLLLFLVIASNFTGYLLPWDQLAYWAITVSTNIIGYFPFIGNSLRTMVVGGDELNASTLQTFFTVHTALFPFALIAIVLYHFWSVRKAGGVLTPPTEEPAELVPTVPELVYREFIAALVLLATLFAFAALFNAPLLEKANPAFSMNPTKAPWYFAGVQELLMHFHPFFAAFVIPGCVTIFLLRIPFIKYNHEPDGTWFISDKGKESSKSTAIFAMTLTIAGILLNEFIPDLEVVIPGIPAVISNGMIPFTLMAALMAAYYHFSLKKFTLSKAELVQAIFVFLMTGFVVLTLTAIFFRGKDMALTFPWNL